ncbi:MAG: hypothetical protein IT287_06490, partial [Bdellovibrionaceae bacterium]|nr:hypothetical protein [Pseudobdellovibrionaceae bacterium]
MKVIPLILTLLGTILVSCTSTKTTTTTMTSNTAPRTVSSSDFNEEDAHQIAVWDEKTEEGTALGEMPESTSADELVDIADLGMGALLHKANLQCSV